MSKYKLVLFDLDNTLMETAPAGVATLQLVLADEGIDVTKQQIRKLLGLPGVQMAEHLGAPDPITTVKNFNERIGENSNLMKEFNGVNKMIQKLQKNGLQVGIVTSKMKVVYQKQSEFYPFSKIIDKVVYQDDTKKHKPNADPLLFALDKYFKGISPEQTLYVGDALYDMKSAHAANMDFANAGWGAIPGDDFSEAEFVFKQPIELANTITEL